MRILHVIASLSPATGGTAVAALSLAAAQRAGGEDARIVTYGEPGGGAGRELAQLGVPGAVGGVSGRGDAGVPVTWVESPSRVEVWRGAAAGRVMARLVGESDVVHLHGLWEGMLRAGARAARRAGVGYVVSAHGMAAPWALGRSRWKKWAALRAGVAAMLGGAAWVHVSGEHEAAEIRRRGWAERVEVVGNGVFPEAIDAALAAAQAEAVSDVGAEGGKGRGAGGGGSEEADGRGGYGLFLGRLHRMKGVELLMDARDRLAARRSGVRLIVAGPGDGMDAGVREAVHRTAARRACWVGPAYGAEKWGLLGDAAVFVQLSHNEGGTSLSLLEAMACRLPLVITPGCYFDRAVEAGAAVLVPRDPDAVAEAIIELIDDPARRAAMGESGRRLVESEYAWPAIAARMVELYGDASAGA